MKKRYSIDKCPKCGWRMVITETPTFDETVVVCKCKKCNYSATYSR